MGITNVLSLLGGIALFLFGMSLMGEGLKKAAGSRLEQTLYRLSGTPLKGVLLGAGVTAFIQSSSATSAIVVGFVNSGMMKVKSAIPVLTGAIVGTSVTGWIVCLSYVRAGGAASLLSSASISAAAAVAGILLRMASKKQGRKQLGGILLGFSVLMFGMQAMSGAVAPLKESPGFLRFMTLFSNPFAGILAGAAFTALLQSASAAVGILQAISASGAITFAEAFPLLLGISIGAAVPVLLSSIGSRTDGRRTAWAYLILQAIGVTVVGGAYYAADAAFGLPLGGMEMDPVRVAAANTLFRLCCAALLLPFTGQIERLLNALFKESAREREANADFDRLDDRFLKHPDLAAEQVRLSVNAMAVKAHRNLLEAVALIGDYSEERARELEREEELVDRYEDRIGTYLMKMNRAELDEKVNRRVTEYLHAIGDFERISDHAMNVCETAREKSTKGISFSGAGERETGVLFSAVREILDLTFTAFAGDDVEKARRVEPLEERIDVLCSELKMRHVERLRAGACSLEVGFVFSDLLTDLERAADHCSNVAIAMLEVSRGEMEAHEYLLDLKARHSQEFDRLYAQYAEKYAI